MHGLLAHSASRTQELADCVVSSLATHIGVIDADGNIVAVNEAWEEFAVANDAPVSEKTCIGANYLDECRRAALKGDAIAAAALSGIEAVLSGDQPRFAMEYPCDGPGEERWFLMEVTPLFGDQRGAVVSHLNITDRKKAELDLLQAKQQVEQQSESRRRSLAELSHDIRSPVTSILGFATMLGENVETEEMPLVEAIERNCTRLLGVLESVWQEESLGLDGVRVALHRLDVVSEARECVELIRPLATEKGLALQIAVPHQAVTAMLDRACLHRVLQNVVGNAIKYTREGTVTVEIETTTERVEVRVRDTGVGISSEFLPNVFDESLREPGSTGDIEGHGIGLSIAKRLVGFMNGTIEVDSEQGVGSTFVVSFPLDGAR